MSSSVHGILGAVYQLLSNSTSTALMQASEHQQNSWRVSEALKLLAEERRLHESTDRISVSQIVDNRTPQQEPLIDLNEVDSIHQWLTFQFPSEAPKALKRIFSNIGISVALSEKDSKYRYLRKVALSISRQTTSRKRRIIGELPKFSQRKDQLQGWVDVIRKKGT
jgi:hypothetical protein